MMCPRTAAIQFSKLGASSGSPKFFLISRQCEQRNCMRLMAKAGWAGRIIEKIESAGEPRKAAKRAWPTSPASPLLARVLSQPAAEDGAESSIASRELRKKPASRRQDAMEWLLGAPQPAERENGRQRHPAIEH